MRTLLLALFVMALSLRGAWQAGAAAVDITPKEPIWLAGYGGRDKPSESVRQPIHAKALALKDDRGAVSVIVTMDLAGVQQKPAGLAAQRAAKELHIPRERIIFNASHTHSAPVVGDFSMYLSAMGAYREAQTAALNRFNEKLPDLLYEAIEKSVRNLRPATLSFEQGYAGFAVNRRRVGHREFPGPVDQDVPVLAVKGSDGKMIAILFGYACHNTVMGDYTMHGDYAGYAQLYLEQRFPGAVALFVQGAGADANPLPRRRPEQLERYGATLADAVEDVVRGKMKAVAGPIAAAIAFPELAFEGTFDRARWEREAASKDAREADHGRRMLAIIARDGAVAGTHAYTVEAWQFGKSLTLIALAGEVTVDYALKFKARYGPDTTWIAGYSNDACGYIPSLRVWKEGGYEAGEAFRFSIFPGRWQSDIEDRITAAVERIVTQVRGHGDGVLNPRLRTSQSGIEYSVPIALVGDSTVNDGGGWGPGFRGAFNSGVQVTNLALNGRSSKSFRDEGAWSSGLALKPEYVLIQFGHNDGPGKGSARETDPKTTYRENMARYVDEVRAAGGKPVLVTSIVRRAFTADGKFKADTLVPYVEEVRALAAEKKVPLIDLYELTRAQAEKLGPEGCATIDAVGPDGKRDHTHLGPKGQHEIGLMAAREFVRLEPAMKPYLRAEAPRPIRVVVAADGSGDFKTIQQAIDHAPTVSGSARLILEIRPGTYHERVFVPQDRARVTFLGQDAKSTVITADMSAAKAGGTFLSSTAEVQGAEFEAENITFENSFGAGSQAVAISVYSDRAVFRKCRFIGWQDTLYANYGRQYYKDCFIEGHVDFIFGNAAAVFDNCEIHSRGHGYITAQSRTIPNGPTGYVFYHCKLTGENTETGVYLGRPWRPYSRVVYIDCEMGDHIRPEGWDNWRNPENEKTAWYAEFGSAGPGAKVAQRVPWSHQLTAAEAARFRPELFLRGNDDWNPDYNSARSK